jgi:hypothetical protein
MPEAKSKHIQHNNKKVTLSLKFYTQRLFFTVKLNVAITSFSMWCVIMVCGIQSDCGFACHEMLSSARSCNLSMLLCWVLLYWVAISSVFMLCAEVSHKNIPEHAKQHWE